MFHRCFFSSNFLSSKPVAAFLLQHRQRAACTRPQSGAHQISVDFKQSELNKFVLTSIIDVAIRARMSWRACEACVWIELTVCWVILAVFCYFLWTSKRMNAKYQVDPSFQILSSQCLELSSNNSFQIPCGSTEINYIQLHGRYLTTKCFPCLSLFYLMDTPWAIFFNLNCTPLQLVKTESQCPSCEGSAMPSATLVAFVAMKSFSRGTWLSWIARPHSAIPRPSEINEREDVHCDARQHGCLKLIFSSIFNI